MPRHAVTDVALENADVEPAPVAAASTDEPRQATTAAPVSQPVGADMRVVNLLERENDFLRGQVVVTDEQIKEVNERARETNLLTGGLQKLLTPLLGRGEAPHARERMYDHPTEEAAA